MGEGIEGCVWDSLGVLVRTVCGEGSVRGLCPGLSHTLVQAVGCAPQGYSHAVVLMCLVHTGLCIACATLVMCVSWAFLTLAAFTGTVHHVCAGMFPGATWRGLVSRGTRWCTRVHGACIIPPHPLVYCAFTHRRCVPRVLPAHLLSFGSGVPFEAGQPRGALQGDTSRPVSRGGEGAPQLGMLSQGRAESHSPQVPGGPPGPSHPACLVLPAEDGEKRLELNAALTMPQGCPPQPSPRGPTLLWDSRPGGRGPAPHPSGAPQSEAVDLMR